MNKLIISFLIGLISINNMVGQDNSISASVGNVEAIGSEPIGGILFPIIFISFLIFMVITLVKYFLDFRLKNKLIERGMGEQLSDYVLDKNIQNNPKEILKWAILFSGIGLGLLVTYFTAPIDIHSLAIMALSIGLSYFVYFIYLRR
ncbi:MAG TPA: hypothetical protein PKD85_22315 [Saprospiraceae bacterium]|nr:hypothetical protein [Saprospiraceae bacterium]